MVISIRTEPSACLICSRAGGRSAAVARTYLDFDDSVGVPDLLILLAAWGDCDSCEDRGIVEKEVEDCFDRYEPDSHELAECLEYVRDTGSFYPNPPGDPEM